MQAAQFHSFNIGIFHCAQKTAGCTTATRAKPGGARPAAPPFAAFDKKIRSDSARLHIDGRVEPTTSVTEARHFTKDVLITNRHA